VSGHAANSFDDRPHALLSILRPGLAGMKELVVNADDFGIAEGVNRGIFEAYRRGIVTSTTLMANGQAFDSAVALALDSPRLGVGIHLNLTEGRPVSDLSAVPSLVNEAGHFSGGPISFAQKILSGKLRLAQVEREFAAQIEKVRAAGIAVTHLDSHKHVHMLPGVFPIVVQLARRFGIPAVRWAVEQPLGLSALVRGNGGFRILCQYVKAQGLAMVAVGFKQRLQRAGLASPAYFYGITQTGSLDRAELEAILRNLPEGTSELMCHPGYADRVLRQTHPWLAKQRERELEALTCPETVKLITTLGIQLIHYGKLTPTR
jgi:chitin disaccharide deacetylase